MPDQPVSDRRELLQDESDLIDEIRYHEHVTNQLVARLRARFYSERHGTVERRMPPEALQQIQRNLSWLEEGHTDLLKGFMCLSRAVARPE